MTGTRIEGACPCHLVTQSPCHPWDVETLRTACVAPAGVARTSRTARPKTFRRRAYDFENGLSASPEPAVCLAVRRSTARRPTAWRERAADAVGTPGWRLLTTASERDLVVDRAAASSGIKTLHGLKSVPWRFLLALTRSIPPPRTRTDDAGKYCTKVAQWANQK